MENGIQDYGSCLLPQHARMLADSMVAPEVAAARGYKSIQRPEDLKLLGFGDQQRNTPGLLIPIFNVTGELATYQFRPDNPRLNKDGKPVKYETAFGSRMVLDIPKAARSGLADPTRPLFITEGARKADAAVSQGLCCVALLGVWNFRGTNVQGGKTVLPDWESIALNSRDIYIAFDSDVMTKPAVHAALARLKGVLESRHARVLLVYLPPGEGGSKVGLDDYLAAGHSVEELLALATPTLRPIQEEISNERGPSQATRLVDLAVTAGCEFWHTRDGTSYATVVVGDHVEHCSLKAKAFRNWLARRFYIETGATPGAQAVQDALGVLEGRALYDGAEHKVHVRLAEQGDAIYLDLANERWEVVEVTADGWRVVGVPPVRFRRPKGMLPLPIPAHGGRLSELRRFVNVSTEADWVLLAAFLVGTLRPSGPYPALVLGGEQGSAKTTLARLLKALTDPGESALRAEPRTLQDLMIAATNSWLPAFDNLSHLAVWLSDALCRLSTGGGFSTRELYSDGDEVLFDVTRPVILTSVEDIATRGDLLDRAIMLTLAPIPESARRPERELWSTFEAAQPGILGGLLDAVSCALRKLPSTKLSTYPRMADFALWVSAAEPALELAPGTFMAAYMGNRRDAHSLALEADPIAAKLYIFMKDVAEGDTWQGSATKLLEGLNALVGEAERRPEGWPKRGDKLSNRLRRIAPNLRGVGIDVTFGKSESKRVVVIRKGVQASGSSGSSVPPSHKNAAARDATLFKRDATSSDRDASSPVTGATLRDEAAKDATLPHLYDQGIDADLTCEVCGTEVGIEDLCPHCDGQRLEARYDELATP